LNQGPVPATAKGAAQRVATSHSGYPMRALNNHRASATRCDDFERSPRDIWFHRTPIRQWSQPDDSETVATSTVGACETHLESQPFGVTSLRYLATDGFDAMGNRR